jgi:AraC-like DNA-binding protein
VSVACIHSYSDPEEFEAAYKAAEVELTPIGRGPFLTRVARLELNDLWMVRVQEASPRIKWAAQSPDRTFVRFTASRSADFIINSAPLQYNEITHLGHEQSYYEHTTGPIHWAGMSLPADVATEYGVTLNGFDVFACQDQWRTIPSPGTLEALRQLHADASATATAAPDMFRNPEVVRSIEQAVVAAVFSCLRNPQLQKSSWTHRNHETIMRRFRNVLERDPDRALYVPEICAAIHVPERTLRACCQQQLGISPKHYLLLRRMHLAHRALRSAAPEESSVTDVATRFGFWHLSRFAGNYRQIFGETPSTTLQRQPS